MESGTVPGDRSCHGRIERAVDVPERELVEMGEEEK